MRQVLQVGPPGTPKPRSGGARATRCPCRVTSPSGGHMERPPHLHRYRSAAPGQSAVCQPAPPNGASYVSVYARLGSPAQGHIRLMQAKAAAPDPARVTSAPTAQQQGTNPRGGGCSHGALLSLKWGEILQFFFSARTLPWGWASPFSTPHHLLHSHRHKAGTLAQMSQACSHGALTFQSPSTPDPGSPAPHQAAWPCPLLLPARCLPELHSLLLHLPQLLQSLLSDQWGKPGFVYLEPRPCPGQHPLREFCPAVRTRHHGNAAVHQTPGSAQAAQSLRCDHTKQPYGSRCPPKPQPLL